MPSATCAAVSAILYASIHLPGHLLLTYETQGAWNAQDSSVASAFLSAKPHAATEFGVVHLPPGNTEKDGASAAITGPPEVVQRQRCFHHVHRLYKDQLVRHQILHPIRLSYFHNPLLLLTSYT